MIAGVIAFHGVLVVIHFNECSVSRQYFSDVLELSTPSRAEKREEM